MKYNIQQLQQEKREKPRNFLFFWGHRPSKDGRITQSCFSQWWEQPFSVDDQIYPTAEHWMMAEKARLFKDEEMLEKILASSHPHQAKKLGRAVRGFEQASWEADRYAIVLKGNLHKFNQHEALKDFLLATKDGILVEASPFDKIWGIGMAKTHRDVYNMNQWKGLNLLGFALMEVREELG